MRSKPRSIDEYLDGVRDDQRVALEKLRRDIHKILPRVEECISYGMPGFRLDGRVLVWFGAGANHCAFYPGGVTQDLASELEGYDTGKGTVRFQPERPLPQALLRKLIKARLARETAKTSGSRAAASSGAATRARRGASARQR